MNTTLGTSFTPDEVLITCGLQLNFSNMPIERVTEGIRRLTAAIKEMLAEPRGTSREETSEAVPIVR